MRSILMNTSALCAAAGEGSGGIAISNHIENMGKAMAAKAAESESFNSDMEQIAKATEVVKRGPLWLMLDLEEVYGDTLDNWPVPGSTKADSGNRPYDKYEVKAGGETVKGSVYQDFLDNLPIGIEARATIEACKAWKKDKATAPAEYRTLPAIKIANLRKQAESKRASALKALRNAMQLRFQVKLVGELDGVKVQWALEDDGSVMSTATPIIVRHSDTDKHVDDFHPMSISAFLKLKPQDVTDGSLAQLLETVQRDGGESEEEEDAVPMILKQETLVPAMSAVSEYLADKEHIGKLFRLLSSKNADDKRDTVLAIGDLYAEIKPLWDKIAVDYQRYAAEGEATGTNG